MKTIDNTITEFGLTNEELSTKAKKIKERLVAIHEKYEMAQQIHQDENTEESKSDVEALEEFYNDAMNDFEDELKNIVEAKEKQAKKEANAKAQEEQKEKEEKAKAEEEARKKAEEQNVKPKKRGLAWLIVGVVALGLTAGAVNLMKKE